MAPPPVLEVNDPFYDLLDILLPFEAFHLVLVSLVEGPREAEAGAQLLHDVEAAHAVLRGVELGLDAHLGVPRQPLGILHSVAGTLSALLLFTKVKGVFGSGARAGPPTPAQVV